MPRKIETTTPPTPVYVNTATMAAILGVSATTLKAWRIGTRTAPPRLTEGAHWVNLGQRKVLFHRALMLDYVANIGHPERHQRAVLDYLASLPSSKAVM